jgi:heptaprenylglyceryl phosphate synthase
MKGGMPPRWLKSPPPLLEAVKTAMPHYSDLIDDHGVSAVPELLDEIRDLVLAEIRAIIVGTSTDYDLEKAGKIISAIRKIDDPTMQPPSIPPDLIR